MKILKRTLAWALTPFLLVLWMAACVIFMSMGAVFRAIAAVLKACSNEQTAKRFYVKPVVATCYMLNIGVDTIRDSMVEDIQRKYNDHVERKCKR